MPSNRARVAGALCGLASLVAAALPLEPPVGLSPVERVFAAAVGAGTVALVLLLPRAAGGDDV